MAHVLYRALNYRNIRLDECTVCKTDVGVVKRDGSLEYFTWLGFIERREAKSRFGAKPVLLKVKRVDGEDVTDNSFVQGCLVRNGVYAVIDSQVSIVSRDK